MSAKVTNEAYREAAQRMLTEHPVSPLQANWLRVVPHGSVMPVEDGAFVELQMWVPKSALARVEPA